MQNKRAAVRKDLNKTLGSRNRERREALVSFVNAMMLYVNVGDDQALTAQEVVYRQPRTKRNHTIQSLFEQVHKKAIEQNESHLVVSGSLAVSAPDIPAVIRSAEKKQNSENTSWENSPQQSYCSPSRTSIAHPIALNSAIRCCFFVSQNIDKTALL